MTRLHVDYPDHDLDFAKASRLAIAEARAGVLRQPAIMSWRHQGTREFSPGFEGADPDTWWAKYGHGNGGQVDVSVGDDFEFVLMETGGFETLGEMPLRNLGDGAGNEYVCLSPMLDDSGRPRRDACTLLDEWTGDQY